MTLWGVRSYGLSSQARTTIRPVTLLVLRTLWLRCTTQGHLRLQRLGASHRPGRITARREARPTATRMNGRCSAESISGTRDADVSEGSRVFEFHGWATMLAEMDDGSAGPAADAITRLHASVNEARDTFSVFEVKETGNGQTVLMAHGLRNHRFERVIGLFKWLAAELPASYGLLYVRDDESAGHDNVFQVWRLARGRLEKLADPFLSPYVPTATPPFEGR